MEQARDCALPAVPAVGEVHGGFVVESVMPISCAGGEGSRAMMARHSATGARFLAVVRADGDPENLVAMGFRTPPPDNTGLPHILEHTTLCGSKRFPVKDPFVELVKSSLATFLNAFTYPDKTVYPCASMVEADFFNVLDIYCDAVFFPLLLEKHFQQEGHHLDFEQPGNVESALTVKGVVFNEMKGAYSDLDGVIDRETPQRLCPDNAYGFDSGGDPDSIPDLQYEQFRQFHDELYDPSNLYVFFTGLVPVTKVMEFIDARGLAPYAATHARRVVNTSIPPHVRWTQPSTARVPYPVGPGEDGTRKHAGVVTFLTNDVTNVRDSLTMQVLDYYLLGNSASPLRKALIDSKLGEELISGAGYDDYRRDTCFSVGLKGMEDGHLAELVDLVRSLCKQEVEAGLDPKKMDAAIHRVQLGTLTQSAYPLSMMDRVYKMWMNDADPLYLLRLPEHLKALEENRKADPRFFEKRLEDLIVLNPHYTSVSFYPDQEFNSRKDAEFRERMEKRKAAMSAVQLEGVAHDAKELDDLQSAPNSEEALASLPRLSLSDVPRDFHDLRTETSHVMGRPLLYTRQETNGVGFVAFAFDLSGLSEELLDYLPLYAEMLRKMGAGGLDYAAMAEREAAVCGGVSADVEVFGRMENPGASQLFLVVRAHALEENFSKMLKVIEDRVLLTDLDDLVRMKDVVQQNLVHLRASLVPQGHFYARTFAARGMNYNSNLRERLDGFTQVRFVRRHVEGWNEEKEELVARLAQIRSFVLARTHLAATSFCGSDREVNTLSKWVDAFLRPACSEGGEAESGSAVRKSFDVHAMSRAGIANPADVAFVAVAFPAPAATHADAPALLLLSKQLSYGFFWEEVRVKKGAYGCFGLYHMTSGLFSFSSYRDPFVKETLETYSRAAAHIADEMDLTPGALEQAVIGTIKYLDRPLRGKDATRTALIRLLTGETEQLRSDFRRKLLSLTRVDIVRAAEQWIARGYPGAPVCVMSSLEKLQNANEQGTDLSVEEL